MLRFLIQVKGDSMTGWSISYSCPEDPGWTFNDRAMLPGPVPQGNGDLPDPVAEKEVHDFCVGDTKAQTEALKSIRERTSSPVQIRLFGRYLFQLLLGAKAWNSMTSLARKRNVTLIELALQWRANQGVLNGLNWEMMFDAQGPIAASSNPAVAITRIVLPSVDGAPVPQLRTVKRPPRVLFVVGNSGFDGPLRAGAEYYGLLREVEGNNIRIHSLVLARRKRSEWIKALQDFGPDVVHFICHGSLIPSTQKSGLALPPDKEEDAPLMDALALFTAIKVNEKPPPIVVLSACFSGSALGGPAASSLAVDLVERGVPVVVAMAGRIADSACRRFTIKFGECLLRNRPLTEATALARQSAMLGDVPLKSVDWALPAIFLRQDVPSDYSPAPAAEDEHERHIRDRLGTFGLKQAPAFWGREEFFEVYDGMLRSEKSPLILACKSVKTDKGIGRKRLLRELAMHAICEGHLPVLLVPPPSDETWNPPKNVRELATGLLAAILQCRENFGLDTTVVSQLDLLLAHKPGSDDSNMHLSIRSKIKRVADSLTALQAALPIAVSLDLASLAQDGRVKHSYIAARKGRPVVFLYNVHEYDDALPLLFGSLLGTHGMGGNGTHTLNEYFPSVLTFTETKATMQHLGPGSSSPAFVNNAVVLPLSPFSPDGEDMLAYQHVLLHPHRSALYDFASASYVMSEAVETKVQEDCKDLFRTCVQGIPLNMTQSGFYVAAMSAKQRKFLIPTDDLVEPGASRGGP